ncbi:MAG: Trk system potassium transporter TrkA [Pseudomonadota bacterium]
MKLIICGAGIVGYHIAEYLALQGHDVTIVDKSQSRIGELSERLDVQAIIGHAAHPVHLQRAGVEEADFLIAVTRSDEVNIVACHVARTLFNVPVTIARLRSPGFLDYRDSVLFDAGGISVDHIVTPGLNAARDIAEALRYPGVFDHFTMANGRVTILGVECTPDCPLINTPLKQLTVLFPDMHIRILSILRGVDSKVFFPKGRDQILVGDEVYIAVDTAHVLRALDSFGLKHEEWDSTHRFVVCGGGHIGIALVQELVKKYKNATTAIIEQNKDVAQTAAELLPNTLVVHGEATEAAILSEVNVAQAYAFVAVTGHDETNVFSCLMASRLGACRTISTISNPRNASLVSGIGIETVMTREIVISAVLPPLRQAWIEDARALRDGFAEILEIQVHNECKLVGSTVQQANFPKGVILGSILHDDAVIIPEPATEIHANDVIILLVSASIVRDVENLFAPGLTFF